MNTRPLNALSLARHPDAVRARVEALETLLERAIRIPVIDRRIGLDAVIGLVPGVGDIVTGALSAYMIWEARNLGLSRGQVLRMAANVGFDTAIGAIPVVGDLFDLAFRSNSRNLRLIKRHLDERHPRRRGA